MSAANHQSSRADAASRSNLLAASLLASLLLNLVLGIWLLRPGPSTTAQASRAGSTSQPAATGPAPQARENSTAHSARPRAPPFLWGQLESTDYRQYVANLRAIGCPGQTVRDIIAVDLNQLYAGRARAIWAGPPMSEFWQKGGSRKQPSQEQVERLRKLEEERQSVLDEVIGARLNGLELANALLMNPNACDTDLAFLPEEKREAAYRALCDAEVAYVRGIDAWDEEGKQLEEKGVAALSNILSPEELEEFRMRINPVARELRSYLTYFECTPDEFKALLKFREQRHSATNRPDDPYLEMAEEAAAFGRLFGEARAREYAEKADLFYIWARRAAERYGLPEDAPDRAWQIKRDAIAAVQQFYADTTLTAVERRQRLETLHRTTESKLLEVLGVKGTAVAKHGDWWLQDPTVEFRR